jgi:hypothetical protein
VTTAELLEKVNINALEKLDILPSSSAYGAMIPFDIATTLLQQEVLSMVVGKKSQMAPTCT